MLGKLIQYELKASGRLIPLVYVVVAMLAIVGVFLSALKAYVYMTLSFVLLFLAGAAALIITYVIIFLRFYRGMFGNEGYLAMTLPATASQVYFSKTIVAFFWLLLSGLVTVSSWIAAFFSLFRIAFQDDDIPYYIFHELQEFFEVFFSPGAILYLITIGTIGYLALLAKIYFCVTLSNIRPFASLGIAAAIIAYILLEILSQTIVIPLLRWLIPLGVTFDSYSGWSLTRYSHWSDWDAYYSGFTMSISSNLLPLVLAVALPFVTIWLINNKVNLK